MKWILSVGILSSLISVSAFAASTKGKKKTYEQAKKECLTNDKALSGKKLQECITKKRK